MDKTKFTKMDQKVINSKKKRKACLSIIFFTDINGKPIYIYTMFYGEKFKRLCAVHVLGPFLTKRLLISINEILLSDNSIRVL